MFPNWLVENMSKDEFEMIRKDDMDPPMVSFMPEMSHTSNILLQEQQVSSWFHVPFGWNASPTGLTVKLTLNTVKSPSDIEYGNYKKTYI